MSGRAFTRTRRAAVLACLDVAGEFLGELAADVALLDGPAQSRGCTLWSALEMLRADARNLLRALRAAEIIGRLQADTASARVISQIGDTRESVRMVLAAVRAYAKPRSARVTPRAVLTHAALRATIAIMRSLADARRHATEACLPRRHISGGRRGRSSS